jgi:hypothetical protein
VLAFFSRIPRCVVGLALRVSRPAQIQRSGLLPQVA